MLQKEKKNTKDSIKNCPNTKRQRGAQTTIMYTIFFVILFLGFFIFLFFFISFKPQNKTNKVNPT